MTRLAAPVAATSSTRCNNFAGQEVEDLKAIARSVLWNAGIEYGPNRINRLCVRFVDRIAGNGFDFFHFLANSVQLTAAQQREALNDPDVQRAISYADPTGETAISNVIRERGK